MNKLQLEGLTKAGAFDEFDTDRNKIFKSIIKIIQKIKNINDDKNNHQSSLFESNEHLTNDFDFLPYDPWKQKELLSEEFRSLGFYISNHPLNEYEETFNHLKIISYNKFLNNNNIEGLVAELLCQFKKKVLKAHHMQL